MKRSGGKGLESGAKLPVTKKVHGSGEEAAHVGSGAGHAGGKREGGQGKAPIDKRTEKKASVLGSLGEEFQYSAVVEDTGTWRNGGAM